MEQEATPRDMYVSPTVHHREEWIDTLSDPELAARFNELVELTQNSVDAEVHPWVLDTHDVAGRWQHTALLIGRTAQSHGHPLFSDGHGWVDTEWADEVLEPIQYRSFDAGLIENALHLTHYLAMSHSQPETTGLAVSFHTLNNAREASDPELVEAFTKTFDLRDMGEPSVTVIGDLTLEEYASLNAAQIEELWERLREITDDIHYFGKGYNFFTVTPQFHSLQNEAAKLADYRKLVEYGTTDRHEIAAIRHTRKAAEIASLRQTNPDFGKVPDDFSDLPNEIKDYVGEIFAYFDAMRESFEHVSIDTYSLSRLSISKKDVAALTKAGILINEDIGDTPGGQLSSYDLSVPYYELWVGRHYPANPESANPSQ